jgi:transposase-like protein
MEGIATILDQDIQQLIKALSFHSDHIRKLITTDRQSSLRSLLVSAIYVFHYRKTRFPWATIETTREISGEMVLTALVYKRLTIPSASD